jgi:hypothetical protein
MRYIKRMRHTPLAALLCLTLAPATAQEAPASPPSEVEQGADLLEQGARLFLRGLMAEMQPALSELERNLAEVEPAIRELLTLMGDFRHYEAPEHLANGDIIIRRKPGAPPVPGMETPDTVPPEDPAPKADDPAESGEIEL